MKSPMKMYTVIVYSKATVFEGQSAILARVIEYTGVV